MKVLWFEITIPGQYQDNRVPIAGWQDSLQDIVTSRQEIELYIAFEGRKGMKCKSQDGVTYIPIIPNMNFWGSHILRYYDSLYLKRKLLPIFRDIVDKIQPDVIHVFGTEWGLGEISNHTDIPVVIHMMGCVAPYLNASFPPNYSIIDSIKGANLNLVKLYQILRTIHYKKTWIEAEQNNFKAVCNYMGRTSWDKAMCELFHPNCRYFHCNEALRPAFITGNRVWSPPLNKTLRLLTIGCTTHWKGMDTILKTANILKERSVDFEWHLVGKFPKYLKKEIEKKENLKFEDCNVKIIGFVNPDKLVTLLLSSNMYVHTAYIDNSPNTICEAQYLGVPIIATYVGGIPSLIDNSIDGILVPANAPYRLAYEIILLSNDIERQLKYSSASIRKAHDRHNPENIYNELMFCYRSLIISSNEKRF